MGMEFVNIYRLLSQRKHVTPRTLYQAIISTLVSALGVWVILAIILGVVGEIRWHQIGLYGALLGVCFGSSFFVLSSVVTLYAIAHPPHIMIGIMLGAWVMKLALFIVILAFLEKQDFFSHEMFGCAVLFSVVFVLIAQVLALRLKSLPIVDEKI